MITPPQKSFSHLSLLPNLLLMMDLLVNQLTLIYGKLQRLSVLKQPPFIIFKNSMDVLGDPSHPSGMAWLDSLMCLGATGGSAGHWQLQNGHNRI